MAAAQRVAITSPTLRPLVAAVLATTALLLAGCGSGSDTATSPTTTQPVSSTSATTAGGGSPSSTEKPGAVAGAATLGGSDEDEDDTGSGSADARDTGDTATPVDDVASDVTWATTALDYRGDDGLVVSFDCPPDGVLGGVWGTGTYTDDSSVCTAAVHEGLIDEVDGGEVIFVVSPGLEEYEGSTANGVTSSDYGAWDGSIVFLSS